MTVSPITSDQEDNLDRLIDAAIKRAYKEVNPGKEGLQQLFTRGGEFQDHIITGFRRFCAPAPDYALAKKILKGDFITPEEIMAKRPVVYTDEQIMALGSQLPSEDLLRWLKKNGFALVAAPPSALSLLDVRALKPELFYSKTGGWYAEGQKFAREDKTSFGWLMIRKTPVPDSTNKTWDEQQQLLSNVESVPNAAEFAWFLTTFCEVRGVRLYKDVIYARVSSVHSDGGRVFLGVFDADGLIVRSYWDSQRDSALGLASSRKF